MNNCRRPLTPLLFPTLFDPLTSSKQESSPGLDRLNKFINFHHISLETFWKSNSLLVAMQQFIEFLKGISKATLLLNYLAEAG